MPTYTLLFTPDGNPDGSRESRPLKCVAPNPWLALEKFRHAIGQRTVELREGDRSFGRFRHGFPGGGGIWEVSEHLTLISEFGQPPAR